MVFYLAIIFVFSLILAVVDICCGFVVNSTIFTVFLIVLGVAIEFAIDGLLALAVHYLPNNWFGVDNKLYKVAKFERKFYEKLQIRKWKDKVWQIKSIGGFSKESLISRSNLSYIEQFIIESNKGVATHVLGAILGFLLIAFFLPFDCVLFLSLPISIVNLLLNLPSLFILRYNTPKLQAGYKRLTRSTATKK